MPFFENKILERQRFAKRNKTEYNVFSTEIEDAATVDEWVVIEKPQKVMLDPESYACLRHKRLRWAFDNNGILFGVEIIEDE